MGMNLRRHRLLAISVAVLALVTAAAVLAPWLATHDPQEMDLAGRLQPPSPEHWFGTNVLGQDVYSRLLHGARTTLLASLACVVLALAIGIPIGLAAGYFEGWVDTAVMRVSDAFLAFPPMLLPITLIAMLGPGLDHVVIAIALSWFPWYARILRVAVQTVKNEPYVDAARAMGVHPLRVVARHVLPNSLTALVVQATVDLGNVIQWAVALELHRARRGRAHARVGARARRRLGILPLLLVDGDVPGRGHRDHGPGLEPGGRRPA